MDNLEQLAQLGGTVATVVIFIWYLVQKDKITNKLFEDFNTTINNHLDHSTKVIKDSNNINSRMAVTLKELCILVKGAKGAKGAKGLQGKHG